jgi:tripartite-type tricarboxylate transporter receptor subunit TctC
MVILVLSYQLAWAQLGPPTKMIVPYPAGGIADIVARLLANEINRTHSETIIIENRPGASSDVGTEIVARATPDGKTLLVNGNPLVINPNLHRRNYDPLKSFEPICYLTTTPTLIVVNGGSPYRTLADLFDAARTKSGNLTLAGIGPASATHIAFESLKRLAKIDMTFVPFAGTAPAVNALLGSHVTAFFGNYSDVAAQLRSGGFRALAVASRERIAALPAVPTVIESGYAGYEVDIWLGAFAPANTSKETLSRLTDGFTAALRTGDIRTKLVEQGLYPSDLCGADFAAFVRAQYGEYGRAIRQMNFTVDGGN